MNVLFQDGPSAANGGLSTVDTSGPAALLDVRAVAALLGCSPRHVYRMADAGKMPQPIRLLTLVRWNRAELERWIESGCKSIRSTTAKGTKK